MAQSAVQQPALSPTLSPPLSPAGGSVTAIIQSPTSEMTSKSTLTLNGHPSSTPHHTQQIKQARKQANPNGHTSDRNGTRHRPSSSRHINGNGHHHHTANKRVEAANDSTIAKAPRASFSIATKPQDRDPSLLRQPSQSKGFDSLSSYQLDHNGRIPASEYNYIQRDKLVASAQQSAIRSGNLHWVALMDLAHLASQHHTSPYSMIKFGPRGSPFAYIPITLQQPEVVENTMLRQREEELQAKAWLIGKHQQRLGHATLNGATPMDSDDHLPVLSLPSDIFKQTNGASNGTNGSSSNVGTKRPASLTTPPDSRARTLLRTDIDLKDRQVERDLREAMTDSINASPSPPTQVLAPPSRKASCSNQGLDVTPPKPEETRMVEIGNSTTERKGANGSTQHTEQVADELMTSSQAGSNVELGGPMDKECTMAQEMEEADATKKPAHLNGAPSKDASLGPLNHTESNSHANGNSNGNSNGNGHNNGFDTEQQHQQHQQHQLAMKTSDTHPIHISPILPDDLLSDVGRRLHSIAEHQVVQLGSSNGDSSTTLSHQAAITAATEKYFTEHSREQIEGDRLIRLRNMLDIASITATDASADYLSQSQLAEQASKEKALTLSSSRDGEGKDGVGSSITGPSIGNLLLSSCPGKKVRLSGPVRGRGAICRDLGLDLDRILSIGVGSVVCCLNDEELSYLGAPWSEYEREADRLGLDIYRLPMAEGFAPTNVQEMDAVMTCIVTDCTMRGTSVLVHCRGGVGRAGLIACAWLLKMGFVGQGSKEAVDTGNVKVGEGIGSSKEVVKGTTSTELHHAIVNQEAMEQGVNGEEEAEAECHAILDTVKCLIETIRRRRSPKAIETAEQVRFLVEYVTYLHRQERFKASHGR